MDVAITSSTTLIVGENNVGKSNLLHAIRLCLDTGLSSHNRRLLKEDIFVGVDQSKPFQVLVGIEFTAFEGHENQEAVLHGTQVARDRARIIYRFRPRAAIRDAFTRGAPPARLALDDFSWELVGGGNPAVDLTNIRWEHDNASFGASPVNLQSLQAYLIVFLPALRDVEADLQNARRSPLVQLVDASGIDAAEQASLVAIVQEANDKIEGSPTVEAIASSIDNAVKEITGPAFRLDVELGLSSPSFQSIVRNLLLLLTNDMVAQFEPRRNGLGYNNILYIAILIEHFRKRAALGKSAGEPILLEEPESHLHPQLQATLLTALRSFPFQSILTTHSTQITSKAPLSSIVTLTARPGRAPLASGPSRSPALAPADIADLERYLDATKSNLLFAKRVMLVEGPAEQLLIPPLVRAVLGIDLERAGVSVVAIYGTHFAQFSRLFSDTAMPKKCAVVADADQPDAAANDDAPPAHNYAGLANQYVKFFLGPTTFERELTITENLPLLLQVVTELGAPRALDALANQILLGGAVPNQLRDLVLRTSRRFGKARFAQVASRYVTNANALPPYILDAVRWLLAE